MATSNGNGKTRPKTSTGPAGNLTPGNPGNSGGKKGRSGRRPNAITEAARDIVDDRELLNVAADIAVGDIWEEWTTKDGDVVSGPTKNSDRIAAIRLIIEYGYGKPKQITELSGPDGGPIETAAVSPLDDLRGRIARIATRQRAGNGAGPVHGG